MHELPFSFLVNTIDHVAKLYEICFSSSRHLPLHLPRIIIYFARIASLVFNQDVCWPGLMTNEIGLKEVKK